MAIADDVSIDYVNKIVGRDSSPSTTLYTVNALYSYLMDTFDELTQLDDQVPMSAQTPTSYTMINGWYIREDLTRQLYGGAIQTSGYLDDIHVLTLDGTYTNAVESDIGKQVQDDASEVGALVDFDNVAQKWFVRIGSSTVIADNSAMTITSGTGAGDASGDSATGETIFANPYSLGSINGSPTLYIYQDGSKIDWSGYAADQSWADGHFDILLKVREAGTDIDSKSITVFAREFGELYSNFIITLTTAGQNAVPLGTALDGNNETAVATVEDWQDGTIASIAIDYNFASPFQYDIGDGNGNQSYDVQIDCNGQTLDKVYEVTKYWTRRGSTKQLEVGTDSNFINGEAYLYADATYSPVVTAPFGTFAGGKFFAAQGVYFTNLHADDAQAFQLIDNGGTTRNPPNYQSFTVNSVVSGDRVGVYEETSQGSQIVNKQQQQLTASANSLNALEVQTSIPADTPSTGYIIVVDDDGTETAYAYTSWSGTTYTVTISASTYSGSQYCYVPYILEEATGTSVTETTTIYVTDRYVVTKVRNAGIIPFVTSGVYGSGGYTGTAIRTTDSQYT